MPFQLFNKLDSVTLGFGLILMHLMQGQILYSSAVKLTFKATKCHEVPILSEVMSCQQDPEERSIA